MSRLRIITWSSLKDFMFFLAVEPLYLHNFNSNRYLQVLLRYQGSD